MSEKILMQEEALESIEKLTSLSVLFWEKFESEKINVLEAITFCSNIVTSLALKLECNEKELEKFVEDFGEVVIKGVNFVYKNRCEMGEKE